MMVFFIMLTSCFKGMNYSEKPAMAGALVSGSPLVGLLDSGSATIAKELGITDAFKPVFTILLSPVSLPARFLSAKLEEWYLAQVKDSNKFGTNQEQVKLEKDFYDSIQKKDPQKLEELIAKNKINLNKDIEIDGNNTSFLHIAIKESSSEVVIKLIDNGADCEFKDQEKRDALLLAIELEKWAVVRHLIEKSKSSKNVAREDGFFAIHLAILKNNFEIVQLLFDEKSPNLINQVSGLNSLHLAALIGNQNIFNYLIENNSKLDLGKEDSLSVAKLLHFAFSSRNYQICSRIMNIGENKSSKDKHKTSKKPEIFEQVDENGMTCFHYLACKNVIQKINKNASVEGSFLKFVTVLENSNTRNEFDKFLELAEKVTGSKEILCQRDNKGLTPLHYAAYFGNKELCESFISFIYDIKLEDKIFSNNIGKLGCLSPKELAYLSGELGIVEYLSKGIIQNEEKNLSVNSFFKLSKCNKGELENFIREVSNFRSLVSYLIDSNTDIEAKNKDIKALTEQDLLKQDKEKKTLLHREVLEACKPGLNDEAKKLKIDRIAYIFSKADDLGILNRFLNIKDSNGKKAIHLAVGNNILLRMFYTSGQFTYLDNQDDKGKTPLHYAAENGEIKSIELIKEIDDSELSILDKTQKNPFDLALENNRQEALIYLVNFKSSLEFNSKRFNLILKNKNIDYKIVKEIYEKGIDLNFRENEDTILLNIINKIVEERSLADKTQVYDFCKNTLQQILKNCNYDIQQKNGGDSLLHSLIKNDIDEEEILVFLERVGLKILNVEKIEEFLKNLDSEQEKCLNYAIDKNLAKVTKKILELYTKDSREAKLGIKTGMLNLKENALERAIKGHKPHVVMTLVHDLNAPLLKKITKKHLMSYSIDHMRDYFKVISEKDMNVRSEFITLLYNGFTEFAEDFNQEESKAIIESIRQGNRTTFDSLLKGYIKTKHENLNKHEEESILSFLFECLKNRKGEWALSILVNENIKKNLERMDADKKLKILLLSCFFNESNIEKFLIEKIKGMKNLVDKQNLKRDQITALMFASSRGYIDIIKILLDSGMDVNTKDENDWTPLIHAIVNNQKEITKLLIEKKADLSIKIFDESMMPLIVASANGNKDIVEILLNINKALVDEKNFCEETALMWAVAQGHKEVVELLIEKGANINMCDGKGTPILYLACFNKHQEIVDILLSKGVNSSCYGQCGEEFIFDLLVKKIDSLNDDQKTFALTFAVKKENKEIIGMLLDKGADINVKDKDDKTVLIYAIEKGNKEIVGMLLSKVENVNAEDKDKKTLLMHAIEKGNERIVRMLLDKGSNVNVKDKNEKTPLMYAIEKVNEGIVRMLLDKGSNVNVKDKNEKTPLMYAIEKVNIEILSMLLNKSADVNKEDKDKKTVLMYAIEKGNTEIMSILLVTEANVNAEDKDKKTVLMYVLEQGDEGIVEILLDKGANVNVKNKNRKTALMYAIEKGNERIVEILLGKVTDVNLWDEDGSTALIYAIKKGNERIVKMLLDKNADVNSQDKYKETALTYALEKANTEIVKMLLGKKVNIEGSFKRIILMYAIERESKEILQILLNTGADVNVKDKNGKTLLILAIELNNEDIVNMLLNNRADINVADEYGKTALMYAITFGSKRIVEILLDNRSDVNVEDGYKKTTLMRAVERENEEILNILLAKVTNINVKDKDGKTALMYAIKTGNERIVEILLNNIVDVNVEDNRNRKALIYAIEGKNKQIVEMLLDQEYIKRYHTTFSNCFGLLNFAVANGHRKVVEILLDNGADVNTEDRDGYSLLIWACFHGHKEVVELLIERGADMNKMDKYKENSLMKACEWGYREIVEFLILKSSLSGMRLVDYLNKKNQFNETALNLASKKGHQEIVELLERHLSDN